MLMVISRHLSRASPLQLSSLAIHGFGAGLKRALPTVCNCGQNPEPTGSSTETAGAR
tara:strand:- start:3047 stop:3217 length:171 start_codon:yes stop_codon:yes gene_type:complete